MRRVGVEVILISFCTPFFGAARAQEGADQLGIPLTVRDITDDYLKMLPAPRYGYGKNMNPCIDCKGLLFAKAGEMLAEHGADFIFSGEVLGQRPMSQNKQSLHIVAKLSGHEDNILRPLSAKLLPHPQVLREARLDVEDLLAFTGRGRHDQMRLAEEFGIKSYPTAAGGCKLTEPAYSRRLKHLYSIDPEPSVNLFRLLGLGRHVRLGPASTLVVGRTESENNAIEQLASPDDTVLRVVGYLGPTGILTKPCSRDELRTAASVVARYSDAPQGAETTVETLLRESKELLATAPMPAEKTSELLI
ncbi:MAG: hypothetical protein JW941_03435 [Candidatus Coatesbacteria bacterium]|nr:hypothetical protein [Candidatus Coatesbacteria bacterium]